MPKVIYVAFCETEYSYVFECYEDKADAEAEAETYKRLYGKGKVLQSYFNPSDKSKMEKDVKAQMLLNQITIMESLCSIANNKDDLINDIMRSTDMYNAIR